MSDSNPPARKSWPDYRAVWRWHFYASLFCIPFVILLSITGAIYLFKGEIEAWQDRPFDQLVLQGARQSAAAQISAALAAFPGSALHAFEVPRESDDAVRVTVRHDGETQRVYIHPHTLEVLHSVVDRDRFMRQMFQLHGELMLGNRGSNLVELAASWTIIMIATGLYLWWPRNARGLAGVLYPRLRGGTRMFWRDLHSVTGVWISTLAIFLLVSGLPWAKFWGDYFKSVRRVTGTAVARQDWSNTSSSERRRTTSGSGEHSDHGGSRGSGRSASEEIPPPDYAAVDRVVAAVEPLKLEHPVVIAPPSRGSKHWTAKSMTPNRPWRVNLEVDGRTGEVVSREDFRDRHIIDQAVSVGIAAHEGRLFGWPNQLLGLITTAGLILLSVSGLILWWRRRDQGVLGAPKVALDPRWSWSLVLAIVFFGVCLPLFGASLLVVLAIERLILSRIPPVSRWLGLRVAVPTAGTA